MPGQDHLATPPEKDKASPSALLCASWRRLDDARQEEAASLSQEAQGRHVAQGDRTRGDGAPARQTRVQRASGTCAPNHESVAAHDGLKENELPTFVRNSHPPTQGTASETERASET